MAKLKGKGFREAGLQVRAGIGQGLYLFAEDVLAESRQIVPVDTGTLRDSAMVEEPIFNAVDITVTFGYALGDAGYTENPISGKAVGEYATDVHEMTELHHAPPTQAKFLEQPVFDDADKLEEYLAVAVRKRVP